LRRASETVVVWTPARAATIAMVMRLFMRRQGSQGAVAETAWSRHGCSSLTWC
jgi:hypothetical protein